MYKVSVIVPVYNVERYIEKCARSLFEQSLKEIEYIFVDDCSEDESLSKLKKILIDYPERYEHTIIHHLSQNMGQAAVRKIGVNMARGEYVIHCDSDDWVEKNAYEKLYVLAEKSNYDIVFCDYFQISEKCSKEVRLINEILTKNSLLSRIISGRIKGSLCLSLIKKNLYYNKNFTFPVGDMTEDYTMIIQLLCMAEKFGYLSEPLYYYYQRLNSITHGVTFEKCLKRYYDCKDNTSLLIHFLADHYNSEFQDEIWARKLATINQLLPAVYKNKFFLLWHRTYKGMFYGVLKNKKIDINIKIKYIITYIGFYPLYHLVKRFDFAR